MQIKIKDVKHLIESLKINKEKEFEKDLKILLEINSHNYRASSQNESKQNSFLNDKQLNSYIAYIETIKDNIKSKTVFENSYFGNILNCYHKSEEYNNVMNFNTNNNIKNDKNSIYNKNLVNFFFMYLIRKYSEIEYYKWLHSDFTKKKLFNNIDENYTNNYLNSYICLLYIYSKIVGYILLKNEGINTNLIQFCKKILLKTSEELESLFKIRKKDIHSNLTLNNVNLIKYAYFIIEILCKNNSTNYLSILYVLYSFVYILSNFFYTCSLGINTENFEKQIQSNINTDNTITNSGNKNVNNLDKKEIFHNSNSISLHYNHMRKYGESKFMELNEMMLYFISKKKLEQSDCNFENIIKDLNILKYATYLKKNIFSEIFMNNQNNYKEISTKYEIIMNEIFRKICNFSDISPLYLNKLFNNKEDNEKYIQTNNNITIDTNNIVKKVEECLKKTNFHTSLFAEPEFNIDINLFKKYLNKINIKDENVICEEKNNFLKYFNKYENIKLNNFINDFYYIGIDFDKTIAKKDTYSAFFKLLISKCYKCNSNENIDLSEDEIKLYENMNIDILNNKNNNPLSLEEKCLYLKKIGKWYYMNEYTIFKELEKKKDKSAPYSDSYYYFLKKIDNLHINNSMLLSYYEIFKDINVDTINSIIDENYELFHLNEYFLEVFLNFINFKKKNMSEFYFDIITLNIKKKICAYAIRNHLIKYDKDYEKVTDYIENNLNLQHVKQNYDSELKKYFNIYYSKLHTYDKNTNKYKGTFEYDKLKIKHNNYNKENIVEKINILSIFDKTVVINKVLSLLDNLNHKLSAFIGDSIIDLDAMLSVDIGIILGKDTFLFKFCEKHDILIKPLPFASEKIEYLKTQKNANNYTKSDIKEETKFNPNHQRNNELFDNNNKILYSTESWAEIGIFFFGDIYNMK
ncbi:conserved Plasmodium protein, unknown function [Plasmodium berghei]|uniref:Uncharacterized protein n=2 Tax=Plasmodium berghei TaxID=5821 RepID=A0A509ALB4_PLABA|nr:conserved Plasmodium protein, unknown function [Plasmodium berghei ANKA]CXI53237.1 conserved Plasmodium protein, unknown function [Plasmodium berghei]SCL94770.1 conserved Plasmodium protein, unknown function [Plasmodium berghei]SCM16096.1 conserved Plasmodium protein, unknown function [Plasmodium berghei]SCM17892.1 conserved Plasmodium protein, unknown function [Plasmodium berghei]SCN26221.1 conserved Plasmodium protein, unknown function [Plasmodium berghei]|eukprot:XP_034422020.1 conserved Plasmodium protein, unknown function [Plasmodium berghei ANKA]